MTIWVQLLGPAPLKFGRTKSPKIKRDFGQLQISITNISGTDQSIESGKASDQLKPLTRWVKSDELWSTNNKV